MPTGSSDVRFTTCPMDCPDTCTLAVTVEDGRVVKIGASDHYDLTGGFVCSKIRNMSRRVYGPDRIGTPKRRAGAKGSGNFEEISWDDAIDEITERFKSIAAEWGGDAILPFNYGGSNGFLTDGFLDDQYFARLGASRLQKTVCAAPSSTVADSMYGKMPGVAFEDFVDSECIVIWGANPKASNIHLVPILKEARKKGAFIAVVDPVRNFSDSEVDLHLPVNPGADLPLALAMINYWAIDGSLDDEFLATKTKGLDLLLSAASEWDLDRAAAVTGIGAAKIKLLAERIAGANPSLIRAGWGIERNRNGGQAFAAILAIPALLGKFGVAGGGYCASNSGATSLDRSALQNGILWTTRELNMSRLGRLLTELHDPPVKGIFVYNCNPVVTMPDQNRVIRGFEREDLFTVVFDEVMTDSAAYADIVLPATTFLEETDVTRSYGAYVVGGVVPVIAPVSESRSNPAVFRDLGLAMGWHEVPFTWTDDEWLDAIAAGLKMNSSKVSTSQLSSGIPVFHDFSGGRPVQFKTVFPRTDDGLIDLCPMSLGDSPYVFEAQSDEQYPLALISPALAGMTTSTFGEYAYKELQVTINPADAQSRNLVDGAAVKVYNALGEVECRALLSDRVTAGTVVMPKGAWRKSSINGKTSNALCPDSVNAVGGGACFNDARVEIEKRG